jgi:1-acyl-sn-glycerol-3-phosphate acyltransferase
MSTWYQSAAWGLFHALAAERLLWRQGVEVGGGNSLPSSPPFLLVADHANALDPYVIGSLFAFPIHFMANIEGVSPIKAAFADLFSAYGRRKGATDIGALRRTFELAASGDSIGIFPEGDRSWDGASLPLRPGVARLAKRLGLPLVIVRQRGNYLTRPRWARSRRYGRWTLEPVVFEAAELGRYSEALLDQMIERALAKDEIKDAQAEGREFSGRGNAEGVERLLWQCPACGEADDEEGRGTALRGEGNVIRCARCGASWSLDANLRVEPLDARSVPGGFPLADLKDWSDWQRRGLRTVASERRPSGLVASSVALSRRRGGALERFGRGALRLRNGELLFESGRSRFVFRAAEVRGFVDNFNTFSEFGHRGERWRLEFGGGNVAKWCYALGYRGGEGGAA